jgi:hypothetical protein
MTFPLDDGDDDLTRPVSAQQLGGTARDQDDGFRVAERRRAAEPERPLQPSDPLLVLGPRAKMVWGLERLSYRSPGPGR